MTKEDKLTIIDNINLRQSIIEICDRVDHQKLTMWSLDQALKTFDLLDIDYHQNQLIIKALNKCYLWQSSEATSSEVRNASLSIHRLSRETEDQVEKIAYRALGHAIGSIDLKDHVAIACDYGVKAIGLYNDNDLKQINKARYSQLENLQKIFK